MAKTKKRAQRTAAYHTKTYTIERVVSIPYSFLCEHCQKEVNKEYKIRKSINYTVMQPKKKDEEVIHLELSQTIIDESYQKIDQQIQKEINLLKTTTDAHDYAMIDDGICAYCHKVQSWKAKIEYWMDIFATSILSLLMILTGFLIGLLAKPIFKNLALKSKLPTLIYLLNHSGLMGTIIGFIIALSYFVIRLKKIQKKRFDTENVEKKEIPILHFDQIKTESSIYEALKDNRIKSK